MVTELGLIDVKPDHKEAFERDMAYAAANIIGPAEGFISYTPHGWGVENPNQWMFTVQWESVEHHKVKFFNSPAVQEWIELMGDHTVGDGTFIHYDLG